MPIHPILWLKRLGIGGRLFLAFALISSITIVASGLATNTYLHLGERLLLLQHQDIPGLDAAARLNDKSRQIVATAPLLVTSDSDLARKQSMTVLHEAIDEMDQLMKNLPDYNSYFRELTTQINNNLILLNQSVEHQQNIREKIKEQLQEISPLFQKLINDLENQKNVIRNSELEKTIRYFYYFSGIVEKIQSDSSFNDLDYTFIRLEELGLKINTLLPKILLPSNIIDDIQMLLGMGSRDGHLFRLKNEEVDLLYQQSFLLENSQQHIQQLAAQINQYTNQTNNNISDSMSAAVKSINISVYSILFLSLASLAVAAAISWFYVRRNILHRITELQQNMRAIASGHLNTQIRIIGVDEVSNMARDLKHFQNTAIEVERTNQQLAAEINERITAESQLKSTQNELIQAGKLAALGQLSVGITHEINQPLTAISSHLRTAGHRLDRQQPDAIRKNLDKIQQLLNKIAGITRHLKAFAREASTELVATDVDKVIRDATELMSNRLKEEQCQLSYHPTTSKLNVLAEPIRLEQVMVNLLSNAIDALNHCKLREIEVSLRQIEHQIEVNVRDTGIGIPRDQLQLIFDPFFTRKEVGQGLGLGLSISYNIMQDFGGQIRVQSEEGQGSCFTLVLNKANE